MNSDIMEISTPRLHLRQWRTQDYPVFARINADPKVMEYYPSVLTAVQSDALAERFRSLIAEKGWGFWAVELKANASFIGFVGLNKPSYELPVDPCIEIGWRLASEHWGKGLATEAATAVLDYAFSVLKENQVYSFTSVSNARSRAVMERLGMKNMETNFNHPMLKDCPRLIEHVLYKIAREDWLSGIAE